MKTYTLFWHDGKRETVKGNNIVDAMTGAVVQYVHWMIGKKVIPIVIIGM